MCTTYTWLAYGLPADRRQVRAPPGPAPASAASAMAGIREEEDEAGEEAVCPRRHHRPRRARHWMGLAIVGVQMAAWCLVGALLMHRGVTTLKRRDAALMREALAASQPSPPPPAVTLAPGWTLQSDFIAEASSPSDLAPPATSTSSTPMPSTPSPAPTPAENDVAEGDENLEPSWNDWKKMSFVPARPPPGLLAPRGDTAGLGEDSPFGPGPAPGGIPGIGRAGTGAATAVVMVTVGGVMLVVGPAFMFIKIMDVYQRQKRLSKLSQRDDPPPSYDEVAEKAPRYSALFQVLENGELTPLSLPPEAGTSGAALGGHAGAAYGVALSTASASGEDAAPEPSSATTPRSPPTPPPPPPPLDSAARRPSDQAPPADEETEPEPDARTPLRPKNDLADAAVDDKSRRRSV